ncbi:MAG: RraA family protein [Methanobrevibacter sp.]|jgi:regulator of RNase E activity RraA|nr:RraA family protein [Methanobrevibacter sp.]
MNEPKNLTPKSFLKRLSNKKVDKISKFYKSKNISDFLDFADEKSIKSFLKEHESDLLIENLQKHETKNLKSYHVLKLLLDSTSSCEISDALSLLTNNNGVLKGLKSINGLKTYGRVVTVETSSDDWGTSVLAIDNAKNEEVLFIKSSDKDKHDFKKNRSAVWGELTSKYSRKKGIAGTFILGYVRDIDFVVDFDYPVFAIDTCPNAGSPLGFGTINQSLKLHDFNINPGDFVFGDKSGVVLIPKELFKITIRKLINIKINETNIKNNLKKGKNFSRVINLK